MTTLFRTLVGFAFAIILCDSAAGAIYAVTRGADSFLYRIDPDKKTIAPVGATGVDHLTGLAYHAGRGILFAHQPYDSFNPAERAGRLYKLDRNSGKATFVNDDQLEDGLAISDLAVDANGRLFGWMEKQNPSVTLLEAFTLDQLVLFDIDTGLPQYFAATADRLNFSSRTGLAFRSDGTLVLKSAPDPNQPGGDFFAIDPNTGFVDTARPFARYEGTSHNALAFDQNDVAHTIDRSLGTTSVLQTINLETGTVTDVFDTGIAGISAITFVNTVVVPEPGMPLALMLLTPMLARRRRSIPAGYLGPGRPGT